MGAGYHRGQSKQDYETPPDFWAAYVARFGEPLWDLAASPGNAKANSYICLPEDAPSLEAGLISTCAGTVVLPKDSLATSWVDLPYIKRDLRQNWLNPPFSDIAPWAAKCLQQAEHGVRIDFLVPASVGSNWFRDYVHARASILWLNPRLQFVGAEDPYPKDLMLVRYGQPEPYVTEVWTWKEKKARGKK